MSHEIERPEDMVYTGEAPWTVRDGFGRALPEGFSVDDACRVSSGIGARIDTFEATYRTRDGRELPVTGHRVVTVTRAGEDPRVLNVLSDGFVPLQTPEALAPIAATGAPIYSIGVLRGGASLFATVRIRTVEPVPGDVVRQYAVISDGRDGSRAYRFLNCATRVVCANTERAALAEAGGAGVTLKHTSGVKGRIDAFARGIEKIADNASSLEAFWRALATTQINDADVRRFVLSLAPDVRGRDRFLATWRANFAGEQRLAGVSGTTAYTLHNVATAWASKDRVQNANAADGWASSIFGGGHVFQQEADRLLAAHLDGTCLLRDLPDPDKARDERLRAAGEKREKLAALAASMNGAHAAQNGLDVADFVDVLSIGKDD
jgi:phage/plasmid-like protein (TIGR03299 family)